MVKPKRKDVNCILMMGGLGDHIGGSVVAVDYIYRHYPWVNLLIWAPDFLVEPLKNLLPKKAVVRSYTEMQTKYNRERPTINTAWDGRHSPMRIHHTDYAFHLLVDKDVPLEEKNYLKFNTQFVPIDHYNVPKRYVVITTGYTAPAREFHPDSVNGVIDYVLSKGYTPVFLGQNKTKTGTTFVIEGTFSEKINFDKGINLIDKTSTIQAAKIISQAAALVGVDNGLIHVAGCTDTPIVAGYTNMRPEYRMPIRNNKLGHNVFPIVPDESIECRFSQCDTNFLFTKDNSMDGTKHDHRYCICDDLRCVKNLTSEKFITQLEKIL